MQHKSGKTPFVETMTAPISHNIYTTCKILWRSPSATKPLWLVLRTLKVSSGICHQDISSISCKSCELQHRASMDWTPIAHTHPQLSTFSLWLSHLAITIGPLSKSKPYACPFFQLPTHQLQEPTVNLLPKLPCESAALKLRCCIFLSRSWLFFPSAIS